MAGVIGGIEYVTHFTSSLVDKHILQKLSNQEAPNRALLLLDLKNCFNCCSRNAARQSITDDPALHGLLPYYSLMYDDPNKCFFRTPDGSLDFFEQHEGFPQGDPMSSLLAALCLQRVFGPIHQKLRLRARNRLTGGNIGDDGMGSLSASTSIVDDTSIVIPFEDLDWYLNQILTTGPANGVYLAPSKTKIFVAPTPQQDDLILPSQKKLLQDAVHMLSGSDATIIREIDFLPDASTLRHGQRFLGQPIGTQSFATAFLRRSTTKLLASTHRLCSRIVDPQTIATIFRSCTSHKISHLLATDVLHHTDIHTSEEPNIHFWESNMTSSIAASFEQVIKHVSCHATQLPAHATLIAQTPSSQGGLGFRNASCAAINGFFTTTLRSLRYSANGIPIFSPIETHNTTIILPSVYAQPLHSWNKTRTPSRLVQVFKFYLPSFIPTLRTVLDDPSISSTNLLSRVSPKNLLRKLYSNSFDLHSKTIQQHLPPTITSILPQLLLPITSLPLHDLPRRSIDNRLPPKHYSILLKRKLRLPLFDPTTTTTCLHCHKPTDPFGDHLFDCKNSKTMLHNRIRDTICFILQALAPFCNLADTHSDILNEPIGIIANHPLRRPADVAILTQQPLPSGNSTVAIDITVTPVPRTALLSLPDKRLKLKPKSFSEAHIVSLKRKFNGRSHGNATAQAIIQSINTSNVTLLPFTIDHFGGIGPFSYSLFYSNPTQQQHIPPDFDISSFNHSPAYQAYTTATTDSLHIISRASSLWHQQQHSEYCHSPSKWAFTCLSNNFSYAIASHIIKAKQKISRHQENSTPLSCRGHPFFSSSSHLRTTTPFGYR